MRSSGCVGGIHARLGSAEPRGFFYPVQFHLEAADFLIQFCLNRFLILFHSRPTIPEQFSGTSLHLTFPLAHLGRMNMILARQFIVVVQ